MYLKGYVTLLLSEPKSCRWISVGSDLKFDARRDLDDVGATCIEGKCKASQFSDMDDVVARDAKLMYVTTFNFLLMTIKITH